MLMAGMFLFLGGCQKEENFSREIRNVSNKTGKYKPVFDTTQSIIYLGGRNNDSLIYLAPKISELLHMSAQLKKISNKHSLAQKAIQLKTEGSNWDVNYATITNSRFPDEYMITLPFVKNNVITGIFLFIRNGEDFDAKLFTAEDIEMFISSGITDNHLNRQYFYATNEWIKYKQKKKIKLIIERNADLLKSEWIQSKLRLISSPPSGRCWLTIFTIQIIEFEGLVGNTEFITITQTGSGYLWCMESHIHNDGLILGENYGGSTSGLGQTEKDLKDKFIGIDTDCLSLLLPDMKDMLLNSVSPCDPDNFNNKITQAFNNACLKAKQDGGDNFLLNIEMWEFNDAMMEALDGVDNITKFQQEKLILMLDKTGLEISDLCDDAPDYDLNCCEKNKLEKYGNSAKKMGLYASKKIAEKWASLKFNTLGHNDCLDAFRHAMFNANNAFYLGSGVAKEFGDAHECDNSPTDYFEGVMDLHNN